MSDDTPPVALETVTLTVSDTPLAVARDMIERWTRAADALAEEGDFAALGDGLERVRALRQQLSVLERHIEPLLAELLPHKREIVPGVVGMERKRSTNRRAWDHEGLMSALWQRSHFDLETGEEDLERQPDRFRTMVSLSMRPEWRVTPLRAYGLDVGEYCDETPGPVRVQTWRPEEKDDG